ncbi:hypothetical protein [Rhizomicrobium electricum]|uniref:PH domain-containing protein n=1 Tax=Rhizomicrobium electricum TaxID=480070 RepID=A0ABN1E6A2_9PROT|nr:hypothetical protein [Rhizomicrobium electricum]NIJ47760.1 hypothetical protein [Rhizomicrobium electricum]
MICFRQSRLKLIAATVLFAAWAVAFAFMAFVSAYLTGLWPYVGLSALVPLAAAFAIAAFMTAMSFATPATLTLDDGRLVFKTWRRTEDIALADIAGFMVIPPTAALRSPACEKKTGPRKFVSFGRYWEKTPEEIVAALKTRQTE